MSTGVATRCCFAVEVPHLLRAHAVPEPALACGGPVLVCSTDPTCPASWGPRAAVATTVETSCGADCIQSALDAPSLRAALVGGGGLRAAVEQFCTHQPTSCVCTPSL